ncbi:uncharacterized protein STEHIDRAFT_135406 [Stereum hirsutum FP-91666 SS1]|uniref:C2H2-type domain-containing protein n=1 Tax=Stereum hirsutum (strain FP-91666) TaxID=721885 RepID=R7RXM3_STEHR|nr:uncharacterized protein STEHIDRAFT_135406 [Stereum hirsutum FP-91666 SS1]EIM80084.1 hypothetical protein STEHIDRAFT_135406 [Stereum hirsutum FP-91666 SS1]
MSALVTSSRLTRAQVLQRALANRPELQTVIDDDSSRQALSFKILQPATLAHHERIKTAWKEFVGSWYEKDPTTRAQLDFEWKPGAPHPERVHIKNFVLYLSLTMQGRFGDWTTNEDGTLSPPPPTLGTVRDFIIIFTSLFNRYVRNPLPKSLTDDVMHYLRSAELAESVKLSKGARFKHVSNSFDIQLLLEDVYSTPRIKLHRLRFQNALPPIITSITTERPGAIVESHPHRGSNEALAWKDLRFFVVPNELDPRTPHVFVMVTIRLQKGLRHKEGAYKSFFLYPEPASNRVLCPLLPILYLAFDDNIFEDLQTPEELLTPRLLPTAIHELRIRPSKNELLILRRQNLTPDGPVIDPQLAMPYSALYRQLYASSIDAGFPFHFTMYAARRGAGQRITTTLSEDERKQAMGHTDSSETWIKAYLGKINHADLQSVQVDRAVDSDQTSLFGRASGLASRADPNAPKQLTIAQRQELENAPELVALRLENNQCTAKARLIEQKLYNPTFRGDRKASEKEKEALTAQAHTCRRNHLRIFLRESRVRLLKTRKQYFIDNSHRQLTGKAAPRPTPMLIDSIRGQRASTSTTEAMPMGFPDDVSIPVSTAPTFESTVFDPLANFLQAISSSETTGNDHLLACVNAALALPERISEETLPGESPTAENKCPICDLSCTSANMIHGVGLHIHRCIEKRFRAQVQTFVEDTFTPVGCQWHGCPCQGEVWKDRPSFIVHLHDIIDHGRPIKRSLHSIDIPSACQWVSEQGYICGRSMDEDGLDWNTHFAVFHGLNTHAKVRLDYCSIRNIWIPDYTGDHAELRTHVMTEYDQLFAQFEVRTLDDTIPEPIGIATCRDGAAIQYEVGSGFEGVLPDCHGHIVRGLAITPLICPVCVYDRALDMVYRMKQYTDVSAFARHFRTVHVDNLELDSEYPCAVPVCGIKTFNVHDLVRHYVTNHRLPICGTGRETRVRVLLLPALGSYSPDTSSSSASFLSASFLAEPTAGTSTSLVPPPLETVTIEIVAQTNSESSDVIIGKRPRKQARVPKIEGYCTGCRKVKKDIIGHLQSRGLDTQCRKKSSYVLVGDVTAQPIPWVPTAEDNALIGSRDTLGRSYFCNGCLTCHADIRDHLPNNCPKGGKSFRYNATGKNARKGTYYKFEEWIKDHQGGAGPSV